MKPRAWLAVILAVGTGGGLMNASARADAPAGRFVDNGDGTVTDQETKLVWQQTASLASVVWSQAVADCSSNVAGLPGSGWRLPNVKELATLVDRSREFPAIDEAYFFGAYDPGGTTDDFWSATCYQPGPGWAACPEQYSKAWTVEFRGGQIQSFNSAGNGTTVGRMRCVR